MSVPQIRIRTVNDQPVRGDGDFVLYWMIAFRRSTWNFALQRAVELSQQLKKPLVILEALRCDYRWASDRLHRFVLQGMQANRAAFAKKPVLYYPYVEPKQGAGHGLLAALGNSACAIVTDDFPCFFLPRMIDVVGRRAPICFEAIDSNGILPMRATDVVFTTAHAFRRFLQKELPNHFEEMPERDPLAKKKLPALKKLPSKIEKKWPPASDEVLEADESVLKKLPIDHTVLPAAFAGGSAAAAKMSNHFLEHNLDRYADDRNQPDDDASSGLSPYLHFGHISSHEVFAAIARREEWSPYKIAEKATGSREGWWGMSPPAEAFLDQIITWREVGYNMCCHRDDYDQFESLPDWARKTLKEHEDDPREHVYSLEEFESAATHDHVWNAAQRQLVREGRMHNYLRMLWGKKILHWTANPRDALEIMIELNNKYAVDGRNPNSYSGIFWTLGRYDRAWGPERPIFGKIRYMTSDSTLRKLKMKEYLQRYSDVST